MRRRPRAQTRRRGLGARPYAPCCSSTPEIGRTPVRARSAAPTRRGFRPLGEHRPRHKRHEHDLYVREHGREAGADVVDRVVPEDQVGGEEDSGGHGDAALGPRPPPEPSILEPRQEAEDRQRERAPEVAAVDGEA